MLFGPVWYLVFQESDFKSYASFTESQSMVKNQKKKRKKEKAAFEKKKKKKNKQD